MLCEVFHVAILSFLEFVTCGLPNMSLVGISIFRFQLIDYKLCAVKTWLVPCFDMGIPLDCYWRSIYGSGMVELIWIWR